MKTVNNIIAKIYQFIMIPIKFVSVTILKLLDRVPLDKKLHFLAGFLISSLIFLTIVGVSIFYSNLRLWEVALLSFILTMFPALGKEIKDLKVDKWDIIYTMIGALVASIQNLLLVNLA
jgi:uncharacterized membrane protein YGL010W